MNQPSPYSPFTEPFPGSQQSAPGGPPVFSANAIPGTPYGYAAAHPSHPGATPARPRRTGLIVGCCLAVVSTLVIAGLVGWLTLRTDPNETAIRSVTADFTAALAAGDVSGAARDLCAAESDALKDVHVLGGGPRKGGAPTGADAQLRDVTIRGEVAAAVSTAKPNDDLTFYYRKESGAWKLCHGAKQDFDAAAK